jgi:hypothetical protein
LPAPLRAWTMANETGVALSCGNNQESRDGIHTVAQTLPPLKYPINGDSHTVRQRCFNMRVYVDKVDGARACGGEGAKIIALRKPEAKVVAFFSYGEAFYGGPYYDTQSLESVLKPQCLLATHMNGIRLPQVYGAPLRLRVENQLGYKMVKWIERIEFIASEKLLGRGEGGKNEDDEYFDLLPNI